MPVKTNSTASAFRRRASFDKMLDPGLLRALAEPNRTSLLSCLLKCGRPCSVSEIAACCDLDFSVVSRHLQSLARCGLVVAAKRGRTVWYRAAGDVLSAYLRRLADAVDELTASERAGAGCCPPGACAAPNLTKQTTSPAGCR